jgi:hypothetical protein
MTGSHHTNHSHFETTASFHFASHRRATTTSLGGNLVQRPAERLIAIVFCLVCFAMAPSSLFAQKVELFVGDSYTFSPVSVNEQVVYCPVEGSCSVPGTIYTNREGLNGWEISATHHFSPSLALTADASAGYGLATSGFPTNGRARQYAFLGGPQYSGQGRISPFVHVLFGAAHQSASASGNSFFVTFPDSRWGFAAEIGAGVDAKITPSFSFRLVQADYMLTRLGGSTQSQPRLSAGFVFRF